MADVVVYDKYNRPKSKKEKGGGPSRVERGDSIPVMKQISHFLRAGVRLADIRRAGQYDFDAGVEVPDDVQPDPTRNYMFDLADASVGLNSIKPIKREEVSIEGNEGSVSDKELKEDK